MEGGANASAAKRHIDRRTAAAVDRDAMIDVIGMQWLQFQNRWVQLQDNMI